MDFPIRRPGVEITSTGRLLRTKMAPDKRLEHLMSAVRHDAAILRVRAVLRAAVVSMSTPENV